MGKGVDVSTAFYLQAAFAGCIYPVRNKALPQPSGAETTGYKIRPAEADCFLSGDYRYFPEPDPQGVAFF